MRAIGGRLWGASGDRRSYSILYEGRDVKWHVPTGGWYHNFRNILKMWEGLRREQGGGILIFDLYWRLDGLGRAGYWYHSFGFILWTTDGSGEGAHGIIILELYW